MMSTDFYHNLKAAYKKWQCLLGNDYAILHYDGKQLPNVSEYRNRNILGELFPKNLSDLQTIVKDANYYKIPLYTVSAGKNWGMGSNLPVFDSSILLNLKRLNKVIEVNEKFRYMVLEPGVTVLQVSQYLKQHHPEFMFYAGGAGGNVSPVGNILDRGTGVLGLRDLEDILALEVCLSDGTIIKTGHWNLHNDAHAQPFIHCYPYGYGADLRGLFIQSNFGIVTKLVLRITPKKPRIILETKVKSSNVGVLVDALKILRDNALTDTGITIFSTVPATDWIGIVSLTGSYNMMSAAKSDIDLILKQQPGIDYYFYDTDDVISCDEQQYPEWVVNWSKRLHGDTKSNYLDMLSKQYNITVAETLDERIDSDKNIAGFLVANVVVPFDSKYVQMSIDAVKSVNPQFSIVFSDLKKCALKGHISILFDRNNSDEIKKVHNSKNAIFNELTKLGIYPQRLDIDSMREYCGIDKNSYWATLGKIKTGLDKTNILSPGRYLFQKQ